MAYKDMIMSTQIDSNIEINHGNPGRPRSIPPNLIPRIIQWYKGGLGYRAISRELEDEGVFVTYSTVRRVVKIQISEKRAENMASSVTVS